MTDEIATVARALSALGLTDAVFVGGAVIGLLLTDPVPPSVRQTEDVDVVTPLISRRTFNRFEASLREAGHSQPLQGPLCRWLIHGVTVDLMPPIPEILGFSNRWYLELIEHATSVTLPDGTTIRLASAPYLIASKLEAFHGRGANDYQFSHDITDIIIILDGREELAGEIAGADPRVQEFITTEFTKMLASAAFYDSLPGHLAGDEISQSRAAQILERMSRIARG
jgi:hypothetical protein